MHSPCMHALATPACTAQSRACSCMHRRKDARETTYGPPHGQGIADLRVASYEQGQDGDSQNEAIATHYKRSSCGGVNVACGFENQSATSRKTPTQRRARHGLNSLMTRVKVKGLAAIDKRTTAAQ
jgi:hypothetical protein